MFDAPRHKAVVPTVTVVLLVVVGILGNPFFLGGSGALASDDANGPNGGGDGGGDGSSARAAQAHSSDGVSLETESRSATDRRGYDGFYEPVVDDGSSETGDAPADGDATDPSRSLLNTDESVTFLWQGSVMEVQTTGGATINMWQRSVAEASGSLDPTDGSVADAADPVTDATGDTVDSGTDSVDNVTDDGEEVVDDTTDDATDTVDDTTSDDDTTDTVDDTTDTVDDTVDDTTDDTTDTVDDTTDTLTGSSDDESTPTPTPTDSDDDGLLL